MSGRSVPDVDAMPRYRIEKISSLRKFRTIVAIVGAECDVYVIPATDWTRKKWKTSSGHSRYNGESENHDVTRLFIRSTQHPPAGINSLACGRYNDIAYKTYRGVRAYNEFARVYPAPTTVYPLHGLYWLCSVPRAPFSPSSHLSISLSLSLSPLTLAAANSSNPNQQRDSIPRNFRFRVLLR